MRSNLTAGLDPRGKLVAFLAIQLLLFVPTIHPAHFRMLAVAAILLALLPGAGRAWRRWLRLLALSLPLLAFLALSAMLRPGGSSELPRIVLPIIGKSALVLLSLALFILSDEPGRLLQALRQTGLPHAVIVIVSLGQRFASQWQLELEGVRRAWIARNFGGLSKLRKARILAGALPDYFERLLESSVHIHDAMASRGFNGRFPAWQPLAFSGRDALFLCLFAAATAAVAVLT